MRAMVQAQANSDADAANTAAQVIVQTLAGTIQSGGSAGKNWSVS